MACIKEADVNRDIDDAIDDYLDKFDWV